MFISAVGMTCPVGLSASAACAAMRAGVATFLELPYYDNDGRPIVGSIIPGLSVDLGREERLVAMLSMSIRDCLQRDLAAVTTTVPILIGVAENERPGSSIAFSGKIISRVQDALGFEFHSTLSRCIPRGQVAGFEALSVARGYLQDPSIPAVLVCGVDSYIDAPSLLWLARHHRLKTPDNSDGVIPGEAAAVALVTREAPGESGIAVRVVGLGFGQETAALLTDEPLLGLGLAKAVRAALDEAGIDLHQVDFRLADVTGEDYGFREQALLVARLLRRHREDGFPVWHPAENVGDSGSAAGILQLGVGFYALSKGYSPGTIALCCTSAVNGDRAAAVLEADRHSS